MQEDYKGIFVKNTLLSIAQKLIHILAMFFLLPYMIWRMGTNEYGLWLILKIFSITGYFSLAEMGFQGSIVRYLTKFHVEKDIREFKKLYFSSLIFFLVIGSLCCAAILLFNKYYFLSFFKIPDTYATQLQLCMVVYAVSFLFQFPSLVLKAYYTSTQDFFRLKLWETFNIALFFLLVIMILSFTSSILSIVCIEVSVYFITFVAFLFIPFRYDKTYYSLRSRDFSLKSLKNISGMSYYLLFNKISGIIYNKTPELVLAYFLTPSYLTYYSIIGRVPRTLKLLQGMINSAVLPLAVSLDRLNYHDKMKKLFLRGTRYSFLFLTPAAVFVIIYATDFLRLWVGPDYVFLANPLRIYVFWQCLMFLVSFGSSMYTRKEHFKYLLPYTILAIILFLFSIIALVKRLEIWSILIGFSLSGLIMVSSNMRLFYKINRFSFNAYFQNVLKIPIIFGASFCAILTFFLKSYLPLSNISLLLVYGGVMYMLYILFVYKYGLFDFEKSDINLLFRR